MSALDDRIGKAEAEVGQAREALIMAVKIAADAEGGIQLALTNLKSAEARYAALSYMGE